MNPVTKNIIHELGKSLGFALVGVTRARATDHEDFVRRWLEDGKHGEMHYLADHLEARLDPRKLLPGARSIICVADRYPAQSMTRPNTHWPVNLEGTDCLPTGVQACDSTPVNKQPVSPDRGFRSESIPHTSPPTGKVARYAWGDDYHKIIKKRLFSMADALREKHPDQQYKVAVDTAPILEREFAQKAGLGWVGKHTLLIHPDVGSWVLLGEIITTLEIDPDDPIADHCGTCTRCIDACPTGCISPYELDAQRCISYLTIEHRGEIDPPVHEDIGDWIAGCDVCQEVCPFNSEDRVDRRPASATAIHPGYTTRLPGPETPLLNILDWDPDSRSQALTKSALKRIKLDMFKRNALIVGGNHLVRLVRSGGRVQQDNPLLRRIDQLSRDPSESESVRTTAREVLERIARVPRK